MLKLDSMVLRDFSNFIWFYELFSVLALNKLSTYDSTLWFQLPFAYKISIHCNAL